ncbi:MAG: GntR family transcriptional regulator [Anaerolineae bacterium]
MALRQLTLSEFPVTPVNPDSPIPLYYQVEADLRELLRSPTVASGDLLPTELELAHAYGVGRHTIRTALGRLVSDHLITRKAGHGTVVSASKDRRQFSLAQSFSRQMEDMGLVPRSVVLDKQVSVIGPADPPALQSVMGAPCLRLTRLRYGSDEPIALQAAIVVTEYCAGIERRDFARESLYDVLNHQYHLVITDIIHTVSATTADKRQAELLRVAVRAPLLRVTTTSYLESGEIIELSVAEYRADKYEYTTTHSSR